MSPDDTRRARKVARARITRAVNERGFSAAEERWFDLIAEGIPPLEAAKQAGITKKSACLRMMTTDFLAEVNRRVGAIRTAEGPQNLKVFRTVRDRALDPESSAAQQRVSIEAARYIEGDTGRTGPVVHVGIKIGPGLVIDLRDQPGDEAPMIDVTPARAPQPPPRHLTDRFDLGDDDVEEAAQKPQEPRQFMAVPQPPPNPFTGTGSPWGSSGRTEPKQVKTKPYRIPRRG